MKTLRVLLNQVPSLVLWSASFRSSIFAVANPRTDLGYPKLLSSILGVGLIGDLLVEVAEFGAAGNYPHCYGQRSMDRDDIHRTLSINLLLVSTRRTLCFHRFRRAQCWDASTGFSDSLIGEAPFPRTPL
jgi:hypothetical protein